MWRWRWLLHRRIDGQELGKRERLEGSSSPAIKFYSFTDMKVLHRYRDSHHAINDSEFLDTPNTFKPMLLDLSNGKVVDLICVPDLEHVIPVPPFPAQVWPNLSLALTSIEQQLRHSLVLVVCCNNQAGPSGLVRSCEAVPGVTFGWNHWRSGVVQQITGDHSQRNVYDHHRLVIGSPGEVSARRGVQVRYWWCIRQAWQHT